MYQTGEFAKIFVFVDFCPFGVFNRSNRIVFIYVELRIYDIGALIFFAFDEKLVVCI